jgi:hypothetical protein
MAWRTAFHAHRHRKHPKESVLYCASARCQWKTPTIRHHIEGCHRIQEQDQPRSRFGLQVLIASSLWPRYTTCSDTIPSISKTPMISFECSPQRNPVQGIECTIVFIVFLLPLLAARSQPIHPPILLFLLNFFLSL